MRLPLLILLAALASPAAARGREALDFVVCRQRVDCRTPPTDTVPRDSLLIAFKDDFDGDMAWVPQEKARIVAGVNQLLQGAGFPIVARIIPVDRYETVRKLPDADVVLKYRGNSFMTLVGMKDMSANIGGTQITGVEHDDYQGIVLWGPTRHPGQSILESDLELGAIRPVMDMANPKTSVPRKRAMMAWTIFQEFVHAAHHRAMGTVLSGQPSERMAPACVMPHATAVEFTDKFMSRLQFSRKTGHMETGLMVAGGDHHGNLNDEVGGGGVHQCLADPRIPSSLFDDVGALSRSTILCGYRDEKAGTNGFPVADYFTLPSFNRQFIASYLSKMSAISCYAGCYYEPQSEARAMKKFGWDPNARFLSTSLAPKPVERVRVPMAAPDPNEAWWKTVNRRCAAEKPP